MIMHPIHWLRNHVLFDWALGMWTLGLWTLGLWTLGLWILGLWTLDPVPWTLGWTGECLSTLLHEPKIGYRKRMIVDTIGTRTRSR